MSYYKANALRNFKANEARVLREAGFHTHSASGENVRVWREWLASQAGKDALARDAEALKAARRAQFFKNRYCTDGSPPTAEQWHLAFLPAAEREKISMDPERRRIIDEARLSPEYEAAIAAGKTPLGALFSCEPYRALVAKERGPTSRQRWDAMKARAYHVCPWIFPWSKEGQAEDAYWVLHDPALGEFAFGVDGAIAKKLAPPKWDHVRWPYYPAIKTAASPFHYPQSVAFSKPTYAK